MPNFKAYPTAANMPNRKLRKAARKTVFAYNSAQAAVERKERKDARKKEKNNA